MIPTPEQITHCLAERDRARHPLPYRSRQVLTQDTNYHSILKAFERRRINGDPPRPPVLFSAPKTARGSVRHLSRPHLLDEVEWYLLARDLAHHSGGLADHRHYSFRPALDNGLDIWERDPAGTGDRFWRRRKFEHDVFHMQHIQFAVRLDIRDFFDTLLHDLITGAVARHYTSRYPGESDRLEHILETLRRLLGGFRPASDRGIPQGPEASFFFSELPLLAIDDFIGNIEFGARWVDDLILFNQLDGTLAHNQEKLEARIVNMQLQLNSEKTWFGPTNELWENRVAQRERAFRTRTESLNPDNRLFAAIEELESEIDSPECDSHWLPRVLRTIRLCLRSASLTDSQLVSLSDCFFKHRRQSADALGHWLGLLGSHGTFPAVQDLAAVLLFDTTDILDFERAFLYECFQRAETIHRAELRWKLINAMMADASRTISDWSGDEACRSGKALRALQQHSKVGNEVLWDVYRTNNHFTEMRLYSAAAAGDLPTRQRTEYCRLQRKSCVNDEEFVALECFEHNSEPRASTVPYSPIEMGY